MAQINLLKQKTSAGNIWQIVVTVVVRLLVLAVVGLLAYYGWQFVAIHRINSQIATAQLAINQAQQSVGGVTNRDELYTRQAQLQQLSGLINKHLYWSALFPALANVTLKQASYSNLTATKEGELNLTVAVPDLIAMDKFLQVFDQSAFNANFNNLRIGAFSKATDSSGNTSYTFDARFNFNTALLKYQATGAKTAK